MHKKNLSSLTAKFADMNAVENCNDMTVSDFHPDQVEIVSSNFVKAGKNDMQVLSMESPLK